MGPVDEVEEARGLLVGMGVGVGVGMGVDEVEEARGLLRACEACKLKA